MTVSADVNFEELARSTDEFNGAQLKAVCVEAGMIALREGATKLGHEHFLSGIAEGKLPSFLAFGLDRALLNECSELNTDTTSTFAPHSAEQEEERPDLLRIICSFSPQCTCFVVINAACVRIHLLFAAKILLV